MTHTVTKASNFYGPTVEGDRKKWRGKVTISSYTSAGEVITASEFGLTRIDYVIPGVTSKYQAVWDGAKIRLYIASGTSANEVSASTNVGIVQLEVIGK